MWHQNKDTPIFDKVPNENPLCLSLLKMRPPSGCLWHLTIVRKRNIYKNVPRITNHQPHQIPLFMILVCRRPADNISRYQISDIMISLLTHPGMLHDIISILWPWHQGAFNYWYECISGISECSCITLVCFGAVFHLFADDPTLILL